MVTLRSDLMQDNRPLYANASYRVGGHSAFALGRELLKLGRGCRFWAMAEAKLSDELANQALGGFKNLFEKSFEKGVAQILEVRIILTRALVGVA